MGRFGGGLPCGRDRSGLGSAGEGRRNQLDVVLTALPTYWNVLLAMEPRKLIDDTHTTMMSANITAYSTAVGPSSAFRNATIERVT